MIGECIPSSDSDLPRGTVPSPGFRQNVRGDLVGPFVSQALAIDDDLRLGQVNILDNRVLVEVHASHFDLQKNPVFAEW